MIEKIKRMKRRILCRLGYHSVPIWWKEGIEYEEARCIYCKKHLVELYPRDI